LNQRDDLLDAIRGILSGSSATAPGQPDDLSALRQWTENSMRRWQQVTEHLGEDSPARFPLGCYSVSSLVRGAFERPTLDHLRRLLRESVVRYSGWPPFLVPNRPEIAPYPM